MRSRNFQTRWIAGTFLLGWLVSAGARAENVPCEVVLRAVDIDSGVGIAGISFYRFNTGAEDWHNAIKGKTDAQGYLRSKLKDNTNPAISNPANYYWYGIWEKPAGWGIVSLDDVSLDTPAGGKAEHTFYLR